MPPIFVRWGIGWTDLHPGWQMRTWTKTELPHFLELDMIRRANTLSMLSDMYRFAILAGEGGVYLDTDMECLKNIEPLLGNVSAFVALHHQDTKIAPCILGCVRDHPSFIALRDNLEQPCNSNPKCAYGNIYIQQHTNRDPSVVRFASNVFSPYNRGEEDDMLQKLIPPKHQGSYAIHHWSSDFYPPSYAVREITE